MNILQNTVALAVLSLVVACSASSEPAEGQGDTQSAEKTITTTTQGTATQQNDTGARGKDGAAGIPGLPGGDTGTNGQDGADGQGDADGQDGADGKDGTGDDGTDGQDGADGEPGRSASNNDCCFQGKYFECPNESACFGGFDVNACIAACNEDFDCTMGCVSELDSAGAPKGCTKKAPPAGVRCN